jgi:integrase
MNRVNAPSLAHTSSRNLTLRVISKTPAPRFARQAATKRQCPRVRRRAKKLRGKAIVRGGAGTATRTVGLLGGILTYAVEAGIIESNPAHGIRKPKDNVRKRRLSEAEYRILGRMLRNAAKQDKYTTIVDIIRQIALTGSRRSEMIGLKWVEADTEAICLRLEDSKEGESIRPIGLPVVEYLERRRTDDVGTYVFPGRGEDNAFGSFPNHWKHIFEDSPLSEERRLAA